jgi:parallel beta-helix repeat protein
MKSKISTRIFYLLTIVIIISTNAIAEYTIDCNHFGGTFDNTGFSDAIDWGGYPTNIHHNYDFHETLSGEWGAAIFYNNIQTSPKAMWLTPRFLFPYWNTNSTFSTSSDLNSRDNPDNPVIGKDTAQSKIVSGDGKIEITIDYEVVDLGYENWSPITIKDATGRIGFTRSDRMLFLQTYTIKANQQNQTNVTGLEFYQLLHSHGADEYNPCVNASYANANYLDPLENYIPYNPVHQVGNFKYDFTQWNNINATQASSSHTDYVGFSCTVKPDVYDCNYYQGGHISNYDYKPPSGTHYHVENRNLNNVDYAYGETAGAMGWYLPDLTPGHSTSITVAYMFGYGPIDYNKPYDISLNIKDNISDCVLPSSQTHTTQVVYDINFVAHEDINDVYIISKIPDDFNYVTSFPEGYYDSQDRTVTWLERDLDVNDANHYSLTVNVKTNAIEGIIYENKVTMYSGDEIIKKASEYTKVCCDHSIIFVNKNAAPGGTGYSWFSPLRDISEALEHIAPCTLEIFVAAGEYFPTSTLELVNNVNIYGGFAGWEDNPSQRNLNDVNLTTTINGQNIEGDVITAANCTIDGFTIQNGAAFGIKCNDNFATIENCIIKNNRDGISCENGSRLTINNSFITNNGVGITYNNSNGSEYLAIDRCTVRQNDLYGIKILNGNAIVNDSIISKTIQETSGLHIGGDCKSLILRNCDVNDNAGIGVEFYGQSGTIERCNIFNNASEGIVLWANHDNVNITSNVIYDNYKTGIWLGGMSDNKTYLLTNNAIYQNSEGIFCGFTNNKPVVEIRNNTIIDNVNNGIRSECDPNYFDPNVTNNILWANVNPLNGIFTKVNYNCIQGGYNGIGNNSNNPQLNGYHLTRLSTSCINAGNPSFQTSSETDIDGESRCLISCLAPAGTAARLDQGADEFFPCFPIA